MAAGGSFRIPSLFTMENLVHDPPPICTPVSCGFYLFLRSYIHSTYISLQRKILFLRHKMIVDVFGRHIPTISYYIPIRLDQIVHRSQQFCSPSFGSLFSEVLRNFDYFDMYEKIYLLN